MNTANTILDNATPQQIVSEGLIAELKKGFDAGFAGLTALVKAKVAEPDGDEPGGDEPGGEPADPEAEPKAEPEPDGDEPADPAAEPKTADPEDPEDNNGPGYTDMRMAEVDATDFLIGINATVLAQGEQIEKLVKAVGATRKELAAARQENRDLTAALGAVLEPLTKAVLASQQSLLDIPAAVHNPSASGKSAAIKVGLDAARAQVPASPFDVVTLAKALRAGVITEQMKHSLQRTGAFISDADENTKIVASVTALKS